jgi:hypothetical protein
MNIKAIWGMDSIQRFCRNTKKKKMFEHTKRK